MRKNLFWIASMSLFLAACSDKDITPEEPVTPQPDEMVTEQPTQSNLTTVKLATFSGDPSRITYEAGTRDEEDLKNGDLKLIATIDNPHPDVFSDYTNGKDGERYLSATSVFKNPIDNKYYVTYHFQGNNYNTELKTSIGGAIQVFEYTDGELSLGDGFRASNPNQEDYDFNHIYFDTQSNRIITVGHKWSVPHNWDSETNGAYTGENTRAIIGVFNPSDRTFTHRTIGTSIEVRDDNGVLIDHEDAGDANSVARSIQYPFYFVATRKGIAILNSGDVSEEGKEMFSPVLNEDGTRYFVPTPGSCKSVLNVPNMGTRLAFLYLQDPQKVNNYEQSSKANIAEFDVAINGSNDLIGLINPNTYTGFGRHNEDILTYENQIELPEISPIDGKNTLTALDNGRYYAALGKGGLFFKHEDYYRNGQPTSGVVDDFGNSPVNSVFVDDAYQESYHGGYVYVANGARLTILDRASMTEVASYTLSAKDKVEENMASANYIHVEKGKEYPITNGEFSGVVKERIITVAYGQSGVRIFRFIPKVSPAFP